MSEMTAFFSGPAGILCIIFLVAGIALIITEMCIPGFGVPGVFGIVCLSAAIAMQFIGNTLRGALMFTAGIAVLLLLLLFFFLRSFKNGSLSRSSFVNKTVVGEEKTEEELYSVRPGMRGKAITPMRPAGIVELGGKRMNAETDGMFLKAGTAVEVIEVKGIGIIVHEIL